MGWLACFQTLGWGEGHGGFSGEPQPCSVPPGLTNPDPQPIAGQSVSLPPRLGPGESPGRGLGLRAGARRHPDLPEAFPEKRVFLPSQAQAGRKLPSASQPTRCSVPKLSKGFGRAEAPGITWGRLAHACRSARQAKTVPATRRHPKDCLGEAEAQELLRLSSRSEDPQPRRAGDYREPGAPPPLPLSGFARNNPGFRSPYLAGLLFCRRCRHPRSWWPSRACSAAACAAWPPDKTRSLRLGEKRTPTPCTPPARQRAGSPQNGEARVASRDPEGPGDAKTLIVCGQALLLCRGVHPTRMLICGSHARPHYWVGKRDPQGSQNPLDLTSRPVVFPRGRAKPGQRPLSWLPRRIRSFCFQRLNYTPTNLTLGTFRSPPLTTPLPISKSSQGRAEPRNCIAIGTIPMETAWDVKLPIPAGRCSGTRGSPHCQPPSTQPPPPTAGAILTAPVFGDLEHVGSPGVHLAGFLHPGVAPERQREPLTPRHNETLAPKRGAES